MALCYMGEAWKNHFRLCVRYCGNTEESTAIVVKWQGLGVALRIIHILESQTEK